MSVELLQNLLLLLSTDTRDLVYTICVCLCIKFLNPYNVRSQTDLNLDKLVAEAELPKAKFVFGLLT